MVIISIIGPQGSGKTTIGRLIATRLRCAHIEASDIVQQVFGHLPRHEMPRTNELTKTRPSWLADAIIDRVSVIRQGSYHLPELGEIDKNIVVLTGAREVQVHEWLRKRNIEVKVIQLWADLQTRWKRHKGVKVVSYSGFLIHENSEKQIGLHDLQECEFGAPEFITSEGTNPEKLADLIVECVNLSEDTPR